MTDAERTGRPGRVRAVLFPGSAAVWGAAAAVFGVGTVLLFAWLGLSSHEVLLGDNSVAPRYAVAAAAQGAPLCVQRTRIPTGTGRVRLSVDTRAQPRPGLDVVVRQTDGTVTRGRGPPGPAGVHDVDLLLDRPISGPRSTVIASVCLEPTTNTKVYVRGHNQLGITDLPLKVGRGRNDSRISLTYLPTVPRTESALSDLPQMAERATLFRPGFVEPWLYWVLLLAAFPLLAYGALRLIARGGEGVRTRRVAGTLFALVFLYGASWALITPTFQTPDESEHFAAVQWFGETGRAVDASQGTRPAWADAESLVIDATRELTVFERTTANVPWDRSIQAAYQARADAYPGGRPPRDNGGGFHPATSTWTPLYYAMVSPAYLATRDASVMSQVVALRWTSALMGALTAVLAMLTVLELLPRRRRLAIAAGVLLGFLPQFGFMSGAINNDAALNVLAALVVYLTVRGLRRGFSPWLGLALGVALGLAPLMKGTGYALYPCVALGLAAGLVRNHTRRDVLGVLAAAAAVLAVYLGWGQLSSVFHRATFATPGGGTPGVDLPAKDHPGEYLSYLWQVLIPYKPSFLTDKTIVNWPFFNIYIKRGFGGFGWYAIFFPNWVYGLITVALGALAAGAGLAIARFWRTALARWPEILFLASVPVVVFLAVEAAYLPLGDVVLDGTGEQGRYAFDALVPLAAMVIAGCLGLGARGRDRRGDAVPPEAAAGTSEVEAAPDRVGTRPALIATAVASALLVFGWASWWLVMTSFYT